ncbi:MAG: hypothetical protein AAF805_11345 [Planctomycetota bacterium]
MLVPRFTLKLGLVALTLGALAAIVTREALAGQPWAIGVMAAVGVACLSLLGQAISFVLAMLLSRSGRGGRS